MSLFDIIPRYSQLSLRVKLATSPSHSYDVTMPIWSADNVLFWLKVLYQEGCKRISRGENPGDGWQNNPQWSEEWSQQWLGLGIKHSSDTENSNQIVLSVPQVFWFPPFPTEPPLFNLYQSDADSIHSPVLDIATLRTHSRLMEAAQCIASFTLGQQPSDAWNVSRVLEETVSVMRGVAERTAWGAMPSDFQTGRPDVSRQLGARQISRVHEKAEKNQNEDVPSDLAEDIGRRQSGEDRMDSVQPAELSMPHNDPLNPPGLDEQSYSANPTDQILPVSFAAWGKPQVISGPATHLVTPPPPAAGHPSVASEDNLSSPTPVVGSPYLPIAQSGSSEAIQRRHHTDSPPPAPTKKGRDGTKQGESEGLSRVSDEIEWTLRAADIMTLHHTRPSQNETRNASPLSNPFHDPEPKLPSALETSDQSVIMPPDQACTFCRLRKFSCIIPPRGKSKKIRRSCTNCAKARSRCSLIEVQGEAAGLFTEEKIRGVKAGESVDHGKRAKAKARVRKHVEEAKILPGEEDEDINEEGNSTGDDSTSLEMMAVQEEEVL